MNAVEYGLLGFAAGLLVSILVPFYCVLKMRQLLDRVTAQRFDLERLSFSVRDVNERLWTGGMHTAEEERAKAREVWNHDLPAEEQTNRNEPLAEARNSYQQRIYELARRLQEAQKK